MDNTSGMQSAGLLSRSAVICSRWTLRKCCHLLALDAEEVLSFARAGRRGSAVICSRWTPGLRSG